MSLKRLRKIKTPRKFIRKLVRPLTIRIVKTRVGLPMSSPSLVKTQLVNRMKRNNSVSVVRNRGNYVPFPKCYCALPDRKFVLPLRGRPACLDWPEIVEASPKEHRTKKLDTHTRGPTHSPLPPPPHSIPDPFELVRYHLHPATGSSSSSMMACTSYSPCDHRREYKATNDSVEAPDGPSLK